VVRQYSINNALGWNLIKKHYGVVGFKAYELAVKEGKVLFDFTVDERGEQKTDTLEKDENNVKEMETDE